MTDAGTMRRRDVTRQRLLDAAAEVFAEEGLDAASVEAICERAGFTRGAFYSNFETKEELFLELAATGAFAEAPTDALWIIQRALDSSAEDRLGILLMSEIRIHALRNPKLAAAYLAQEQEMVHSVAHIIEDIGRGGSLEFRLPANEAARLMMAVWESASVRAAMAGLDYEQMCRRSNEELARVAQLIIVPR